VDRGTNFNSNFIQTGCATLGIEFQAISTEAPSRWRIEKVERRHVAPEVAYEKLRKDLPDVDRDILLSKAVKAVNDSVGPSSVSPTFAVFGTAARPALHKDHGVSHADRVRALEAARRAVEKYKASQIIKSPGKHTEPVPGERNLAVGMDVLTYRKIVGWTGPFKFTGLTTTDAEVVDKKGERIVLEQTQVKEFHHPTNVDDDFLQTY
jgi:hypothetical protein